MKIFALSAEEWAARNTSTKLPEAHWVINKTRTNWRVQKIQGDQKKVWTLINPSKAIRRGLEANIKMLEIDTDSKVRNILHRNIQSLCEAGK